MKALTRRRSSRSKAGLLLEFTMLLPITLILFLLLVDGARVLLVSGAVSDATYRSARAGAVVGGAQFGETSFKAFDQALDEIPGGSLAQQPNLEIVNGAICTNFEQYVEVTSRYEIKLLTPGLASAFNLFGQNSSNTNLALSTTAVARCEVAQ